MKCENCNTEHHGNYGSGRFCSKSCARGFSTKNNRSEISQKVSQTLTMRHNNGLNKEEVTQKRNLEKHASFERKIEAKNLFELSKRTICKIFRRLNLPCSNCGWHVDGVVCDIHHIVERKNGGGDDHTNLTYICPNCHRLVHSGKIKSNNLITIHDYIGDSWKQYYYVK
jgi:5-methylcytosine-specific restriction endonuclease McrA